MTLLVDLPPEIETLVQEVAQAEGLDVSALVRETLEARPLTESDLLLRINRLVFPEAFWKRYRELVAQLNAGTLMPDEQADLFAHTKQTENQDAERLQCLLELSKRRGKSVQELMAEMDIRPVSLD
jgi:hypothetical protein